MSRHLLLFTGSIYALVAMDYALHGRWGMALAFLAYAIANIGFVLDLQP